MGDNYVRQKTYTDGDVIQAAHTNEEFDQLVAAFAASSGHSHDGTTGNGGAITSLASNTVTIGAGSTNQDVVITFDGEERDGLLRWIGHDNSGTEDDHFRFDDDVMLNGTEKLYFNDTGTYIFSNADGDLDLVSDGTSADSIKLASAGGLTVDVVGDITLDADGGDVVLKDDGTQFGSLTNTSGNLILKSGSTTALTFSGANATFAGTVTIGSAEISEAELEILDGATVTTDELNTLDGITAVVGELNALDLGSTAVGTAIASKAVILDANKDYTGIRNLTTTGNVVVGGDLTVSGDDITMGTNTSGNLLVADGANFNSIAVGDLSEISTVANDDVFLAVDTSGGGLKKITRSAVVSGLATSSAISNVSEDTTPQLGGNLDMNGNDIVTTSNANIELAANGTGHVVIKGNTNQGALTLNCENNSHGQKIIAAAHSALQSSSGYPSTLTLPASGVASQEIVASGATQTLTNKTLTTPVIAEIDSGSTITLDATTDIVLDADGGDIFFKDDGTTFGSATNSSGNLIIKSGTTTALTFNGANMALAGDLTVNGTTTTVNSTTVTIDDPIFTLGGDSAPGSDDNKDRGIEFRYHNGSAAKVGFFGWDDSASAFTFIADASNSSEVFSGTAGNAIFTNVTGTLQTAAQANVTSLGTLTALTVDNIAMDGATIGHTSDTDLITLASGVVTVAGEVSMTTLDIGGTNVTSTAAELNILAGKSFVDEDDMSSNSATGIASQQSIKAYVDSSVGSAASKGFATAMAIAL